MLELVSLQPNKKDKINKKLLKLSRKLIKIMDLILPNLMISREMMRKVEKKIGKDKEIEKKKEIENCIKNLPIPPRKMGMDLPNKKNKLLEIGFHLGSRN